MPAPVRSALSPVLALLISAVAAASVTFARRAEAQPSAAAEAQSQARFTRGRQLFQNGDYEGALREFRAALSIVRTPNIRLNIARSLAQLGRNAAAYVEYEQATAEAADRAATDPRYATTRDTARAEGAQLAPRIGRLTVHVPGAPEGTVVRVAQGELPAAAWDVPTPVDPGAVEVTAEAPGRRTFRQSIDIAAQSEAEITVTLPVDPAVTAVASGASSRHGSGSAPVPASGVRERSGGGVRTAGFVVAAVGVLGGAGFAVLGLAARERYDQLARECGTSPTGCDASYDARIATGQTFETLANVSLAVGAAALVTGVAMIALGGPSERSVASRASANAPRLNPWGVPLGGGGVAGLAARF